MPGVDGTHDVAAGAVLRFGARVLLVDDQERVLLFRHTDDGAAFWCPVGGGREAGETSEEAARREIREETGIDQPVDLVAIGRRHVVVPSFGRLTDVREQWFLARVPTSAVTTTGWTALERETISAWRWWSVADLQLASERLVPGDLDVLLARLLGDGPPATPIELGR
jgi:8-oxo-dGTP pyrophosphatase MutT (NUDIX family)